jgi:hypothetical protein
MKHKLILIALLALMPLVSTAQADTAATIVDRYLDLLGVDRLPQDKMLTLVTTITSPGSQDTFIMKRWYIAPRMMRVEVWYGDTLQTGLCTNGKDRYRVYKPMLGYWEEKPDYAFYEDMQSYDFRGPLYNWRNNGLKLRYKGITRAKGDHELQTVIVEGPKLFTRHYMFEPTGLLAVIIETDEYDSTEYHYNGEPHTEWKMEHEYMQVGTASILPKEESFMRDGVLTILRTEAKLEPKQTLLFNKD